MREEEHSGADGMEAVGPRKDAKIIAMPSALAERVAGTDHGSRPVRDEAHLPAKTEARGGETGDEVAVATRRDGGGTHLSAVCSITDSLPAPALYQFLLLLRSGVGGGWTLRSMRPGRPVGWRSGPTHSPPCPSATFEHALDLSRQEHDRAAE